MHILCEYTWRLVFWVGISERPKIHTKIFKSWLTFLKCWIENNSTCLLNFRLRGDVHINDYLVQFEISSFFIYDLQWMLKWNYLFIIFCSTLIVLTCFFDAISDFFKSIFFWRFYIFDSWCWSLTDQLNNKNEMAHQNKNKTITFYELNFEVLLKTLWFWKYSSIGVKWKSYKNISIWNCR